MDEGEQCQDNGTLDHLCVATFIKEFMYNVSCTYFGRLAFCTRLLALQHTVVHNPETGAQEGAKRCLCALIACLSAVFCAAGLVCNSDSVCAIGQALGAACNSTGQDSSINPKGPLTS